MPILAFDPEPATPEIAEGVQTLWIPGGVRQVLILGAEKMGAITGYFDTDTVLPGAITAFDGQANIYISLNAVDPRLVHRAPNTLRSWTPRGEAAGDADITRRLWFGIDIDPKIPKGIPATDAEQQAAVTVRDGIASWLEGRQAWPPGLRGRSGNGANLLYAVDLPNTPEVSQLFVETLKVLQRHFETDTATIDPSVADAAQSWRIYGTLNIKGVPTLERPHRRAVVDACPEAFALVNEQQLRALTDFAPTTTSTGTSGRSRTARPRHRVNASPFGCRIDVLGAVSAAGLHRADLGDRRHGLFCPWREQHSSDSGVSETVLFETAEPGGPWGFKCMHGHCTDRGITDLIVFLGLDVPQFPPLLPDPVTEPLVADQPDDPDAIRLTEEVLRAKLDEVTYEDLRQFGTPTDASMATLCVRWWAAELSLAPQEPWARWWNGTHWVEDRARGRFWQRGFLTVRLLERAPWVVPIPDTLLETRRQWLEATDRRRFQTEIPEHLEAKRELAACVKKVQSAGAFFRLPEKRVLTPAELERLTELSVRAELVPDLSPYLDRRSLDAMTRLASDQPPIRIDVTRFDADLWVVGCENGILDLRTLELRPPDPKALITKIVHAPYEPKAQCPRWRSFLKEIFKGDDILIAFMQRSIGYALTGDTSEQVFWILWGLGSNGKTTLLRVVAALLGAYAQHARAETFMVKDRNDMIPADVAALHGARLVFSVETKRGQRFDEQLIKSMTGQDPITARFLHKNFFTYIPAFKILLAVNSKPRILGHDHAIWRRVLLVPFTVIFKDTEQDKDLLNKLVAELPGIFAWAVEGERERQRLGGLNAPDTVIQATRAYRRDQDRLGEWLRATCVPDRNVAPIAFSELYDTYSVWAGKANEKPMSAKAFAEALEERGFPRSRNSDERKRCFIRMRRNEESDDGVHRAWDVWEATGESADGGTAAERTSSDGGSEH